MKNALLLLIIIAGAGLSGYFEINSASAQSESSSEARDGSYSLWLMPEGELLKKFSDLITQISEEYDSPKFIPHVTLLGSLTGFTKEEALAKTTEIAKSIEPFTIRLTYVTYPSSYPNDYEAFYRSLYILAERTGPLMEANQLARKLFRRENDPPFNPHLSIMYGPFPPETKDQIIAQFGREFNVSFEVKDIYLWSDKGSPEDWRMLKKIPVGKN